MKVLSKNRKATFDNEILDKYIAGVVLTGSEVKSIKASQGKLDGAYVFVNPHGAILRNANVPLWQHANSISAKGYIPDADRVLLLTKKQLLEITSKRTQMKAQIIPMAFVLENNLVKLEIAIARSMKKFDKKNRKKEREEKLTAQRIAKTVETIY